jgi:hypothetical protein
MKMEQTQCSETSAVKHLTLENNPKDYTQQKIVMSITNPIFVVIVDHDITVVKRGADWSDG